MPCAEELRLQAYFDGELEPAAAAHMADHLRGCAACRTLLASLTAGRERLRRAVPHVPAPPHLRAAIGALIEREAAAAAVPSLRRPRRIGSFWLGAFTGMATCAVAVLGFLLLPALRTSPLPEALVAAHVHSLGDGPLTQVVSTDRHTVKPWFAGRTDVSPVVADFADQGFALLGGRAEALAGERAAVTVYRHGAHVINVFALKAGGRAQPSAATVRGFHLACWRTGDVEYCALSDAGWDELETLRGLLRARARADAAPAG